MGRYLETGRE